jgi:hypothetical protein
MHETFSIRAAYKLACRSIFLNWPVSVGSLAILLAVAIGPVYALGVGELGLQTHEQGGPLLLAAICVLFGCTALPLSLLAGPMVQEGFIRTGLSYCDGKNAELSAFWRPRRLWQIPKSGTLFAAPLMGLGRFSEYALADGEDDPRKADRAGTQIARLGGRRLKTHDVTLIVLGLLCFYVCAPLGFALAQAILGRATASFLVMALVFTPFSAFQSFAFLVASVARASIYRQLKPRTEVLLGQIDILIEAAPDRKIPTPARAVEQISVRAMLSFTLAALTRSLTFWLFSLGLVVVYANAACGLLIALLIAVHDGLGPDVSSEWFAIIALICGALFLGVCATLLAMTLNGYAQSALRIARGERGRLNDFLRPRASWQWLMTLWSSGGRASWIALDDRVGPREAARRVEDLLPFPRRLEFMVGFVAWLAYSASPGVWFGILPYARSALTIIYEPLGSMVGGYWPNVVSAAIALALPVPLVVLPFAWMYQQVREISARQ